MGRNNHELQKAETSHLRAETLSRKKMADMRPQVEAGLWIIKREDWEVCGHFKGQVWYRMCECLIWEMPHSLSSEVVLWELFHFICVTQTWFLAQCNVWREARRFMSLPASLWCTSLLFNRVANLWLYLESLDNILVCLSLWFCSLYVGHTQNVPAEWRVLVLLSLSLLWQVFFATDVVESIMADFGRIIPSGLKWVTWCYD